MKWGKVHNKKKITKRYKFWQGIYELRHGIASAAGIPEEYILGTNVKANAKTLDKIREMNKIFVKFWNLQTKRLPRRLKKKYRTSLYKSK